MVYKMKKSRFSQNKDIAKSWLYCRWVLYALFVLAIGNIYYLLIGRDYFTLAVFVLVAFLTTFFSKNMVVILCISLVISTIFKSVQIKEGLELSNNDMNTINTLVEKFGGSKEEEKETDKDKKDKKEDTEDKDKTEKDTDSDKKEDKDKKENDTDKKDKDSDRDKKEDKKEKEDKDKKEKD